MRRHLPRTVTERVVVAALAFSLSLWALFRPGVAAGAGTWTTAAPLLTGRSNAQAVVLGNGQVLVMGGEASSGATATFLSSTELYDPGQDTWSASGDMPNPRADFTATVLPDGRVLAAGGMNGSGYIANADIFDPSTGEWTAVASMANARGEDAAVLLPNGNVLVIGGFGAGGALSSCEIYNAGTNTWLPAASMASARGNFTATLLRDGRVLVAGGLNSGGPLASAEIYDPSTDQWSSAGTMSTPRSLHSATLLPDGEVLVAGGNDSSGSTDSAELYTPATNQWVVTGSMNVARERQIAALLPNGTVLVAGGRSVVGGNYSLLSDSEVYDPAHGQWVSAGSMSAARYASAVAALPDGRVAVIGGFGAAGYLPNVDIYTPPSIPPTPAPTATQSPPTATATPTAPATPPPTTVPTSPPPPTAIPTATATATPVPVDFVILGLRIGPNTDKPDWSLSRANLKYVAVGTRVDLSVYVNFKSVPRGAQVGVTLNVWYQRHLARRSGFQTTMTTPNSEDVWNHATYIPRAPGQYVVTADVSVNGHTKYAQASFNATSNQPTRHPVSLSFVNLQTLVNGRATSDVTVGIRAAIVASWTLSGASGPVPVTVTETLETRTSAGWRPLGAPLQNGFTASPGPQRYVFSFVPASPYPALRIVCGITVGSQTAQRAVIIQVKP